MAVGDKKDPPGKKKKGKKGPPSVLNAAGVEAEKKAESSGDEDDATKKRARAAEQLIDRHGAARGSLMAMWRVLRCHPLAKGGLDPVVAPKNSKPPVHSETELCSH